MHNEELILEQKSASNQEKSRVCKGYKRKKKFVKSNQKYRVVFGICVEKEMDWKTIDIIAINILSKIYAHKNIPWAVYFCVGTYEI